MQRQWLSLDVFHCQLLLLARTSKSMEPKTANIEPRFFLLRLLQT